MFARKDIVVNTLVQLGGKTVNTASSLGITFLLARYLGETFYGDYTKVFATATFFFMALDFGFNATVVKRLSKATQTTGKEFRKLLATRLFVALVLYALLALFFLVVPTPQGQGYTAGVKVSSLLFAVQYVSQAIFLTCNAVFQSRLQYRRSVVASAAGSVVQLGLIGWLVFTRASLNLVALAHIVGGLVMAGIALYQVKGYVDRLFPEFEKLYIRRLLVATAPIGAALVLNLFATHSDTILLTLLRSTEEVGYYGLARRVFEVILVFPTFFMNATYPALLERLERNPSAFLPLWRKSLAALTVVGCAAALFLFGAAPLLAWLRPGFAPAIPALRILAVFSPVFFVTNLLLWTIIAVDKERLLVKVYGLTVVVNIALNVVAIPRFGFLAPAVAAGITEMLVLLLLIPPVRLSLNTHAKDNT